MGNLRGSHDWLRVGSIVADRYRLLEELGSGAVGAVFRVLDQQVDGEEVALKVLYPHLAADRTSLSRFQNEVLFTRQLSHPNIVRVYDFDGNEAKQFYFLSMEFVHGPDLKKYQESQEHACLSVEDAVRILTQLLAGVSFAHGKKIIHRDLKPQNILLSITGEVKLTDFGLAQSLTASHGVTATGEAIGTPLYMSPEHFRGHTLDQRSDIYAIGVIAYELVSGVAPFSGNSLFETAEQHLKREVPLELLKQLEIPKWYRGMIECCMKKDPAERFETAKQIQQVIEQNASKTFIRSRLEFTREIRNLYVRPPIISSVFKKRLYAGFFLLLLTCVCAGLMQKIPQRKLLAKVFQIELALGRECPRIKSLFSAQNYSPLRVEEMHRAVREKNQRILWGLVIAGIKPNYKDKNGETPLHIAARNGDIQSVNLISAYDVNLTAKTISGENALHLALKNGHLLIANVLINYSKLLSHTEISAFFGAQDRQGNTIFHLAAKQKNSRFLKALLLRHYPATQVWKRNKNGLTVLHASVLRGDVRAVRAILSLGNANPDLRDNKGRTLLMYALVSSLSARHKFITMLINSGADTEARDNSGMTVLDYADSPETKRYIGELKRDYEHTA